MNGEKRGGDALNALLLIAGLGFLLMLGILAGAVGLTWQPRHTDSLITTTAAICGGGFVIFAMMLGLFAGIALYRRLTGPTEPPITPSTYKHQIPTWQEPQPPMLADSSKGEWRSVGPNGYDLWPENKPSER